MFLAWGLSQGYSQVSWGCSNLKVCLSLEDLFLRKLIQMAGKFRLAIGRKYLIPVI